MQAPELKQYLSKSKTNVVVLTDYFAMECYNAKDVKQSLAQYVSVLAPFSTQVIVLKGTRRIVKNSPRLKGLLRRMQDFEQTSQFSTFCRAVQLFLAGDERYLSAIREHQNAARAHLDGYMLKDARLTGDTLLAFQEMFSPEELKTLRKGQGHNTVIEDKLPTHVMTFAATMFKRHPDKPPVPKSF